MMKTRRLDRTWPASCAISTLLSFCLAGSIAAGVPACDQRPEDNGGPRVAALHAERLPYPAVADLPPSRRGVTASAEHFVMVDGDEIVSLGARGAATTTDVSVDELLRAFWRMRRDPLGGRGAATPSAAPLVIAAGAVPAEQVVAVVSALWHHGARLAVGGTLPGAAREHPVRMVGDASQARGAIIEIGARGLELTLPGEETQSIDGCGPSPDTACLVRALDGAAASGARSVLVRRARQAAGEPTGTRPTRQ